MNAYEKTLEEAEPLSPTTDQLARRFSRDLKIRRSTEQKVFRSPSARKIGSIRRRSRELERQQSVNLHRNQSWHVSSNGVHPRASLKRGMFLSILRAISSFMLFIIRKTVHFLSTLMLSDVYRPKNISMTQKSGLSLLVFFIFSVICYPSHSCTNFLGNINLRSYKLD